ncbi:MAG: exosortase U [Planctomycetota bacterium]
MQASTPKSESWVQWIRRWQRWDWFALVLPILSLSPLIVAQTRILWDKQHMQFFPLALAAVGWFIVHEGRGNAFPDRYRIAVANLGAYGNLLCVAAASLLHSSWLAHLTCVQALFVWMLGRFGNLSILRILGICGLALITLPFPFNGDQDLVHSLQGVSSLACSRMMDAMGILHVRTGNVLEIAEKKLFVEEACSGVDSQYALMAVAGVLLLVGRASAWVSLVTIVTVPIWAILGNILRIFSIVIGFEYFGIDLSIGTPHTLLGLLSFALAAWAHWSSVQFLNWLEWTFSPSSLSKPRANPALGTIPIQVHKLGLAFAISLLLFAPLGWVAFTSMVYRSHVPQLSDALIDVLPGDASAIPHPLGSLARFETVRRSRGDRLGQCSRIWHLGKRDGSQTIAIDMPFRGWHQLWSCYEMNGWTLLNQRNIDLFSDRLKQNWPAYESILRGPEGDIAVLHFVLIDRHGKPFEYEMTRQFMAEKDRNYRTLWRELTGVREGWFNESWPLTVQFQLLTRVSESPNEEALSQLRQQFQASRDRFLEEMQPLLSQLPREFD